MFSLSNFVKSIILNEAITKARVLQPTPLAHGDAKPTASAIVTHAIEPGRTGQVKFQGSWWQAECNSGAVLLTGELVQVLYRQNLTLYVEPLSLLTLSLQQTALSSY